MTYGMDLHGGTHYRGHCPVCGDSNGDVYNYLCESCYDVEPVRCECCGDMIPRDELHSGLCLVCLEAEIEAIPPQPKITDEQAVRYAAIFTNRIKELAI